MLSIKKKKKKKVAVHTTLPDVYTRLWRSSSLSCQFGSRRASRIRLTPFSRPQSAGGRPSLGRAGKRFLLVALHRLSRIGAGQRSAEGTMPADSGRKIDYKAILSPEDFAVFAQLRDLRKEFPSRGRARLYHFHERATGANRAKKGPQQGRSGANCGRGQRADWKYGERLLQLVSGLWREGGSAGPVAGGTS